MDAYLWLLDFPDHSLPTEPILRIIVGLSAKSQENRINANRTSSWSFRFSPTEPTLPQLEILNSPERQLSSTLPSASSTISIKAYSTLIRSEERDWTCRSIRGCLLHLECRPRGDAGSRDIWAVNILLYSVEGSFVSRSPTP